MASAFHPPPAKAYLPGQITFDPLHAFASGGYGDLFKGSHPSDGSVALKRLRLREGRDSKQEWNDFLREATIWQGLGHRNILSFLGVLLNPENDMYLVSPWVEHGSLNAYISHHPDADRAMLIRDVADGLAYLHSLHLVHGDLKGANALVTSDQVVVLCDFGLSKMLESHHSSTGCRGSIRWESPELMEDGPRSCEADVYAFGITIYEVLSGRLPFERYVKDSAVMVAVINRNERPLSNTPDSSGGSEYPELWRMAEKCWTRAPNERPSMRQVIDDLWSSVSSKVAGLGSISEMPLPLVGQSQLMTLLPADQLHSPNPSRPVFRGMRSVAADQRGRYDVLVEEPEGSQKRPYKHNIISERKVSQRRHRSQTPSMANDIMMRDKFKRIEALPRAKFAPYDSQRSVELSSCLEGTRTQVLADIRGWISNTDTDAKRVFLLNGMAGTGKTTIAYTIAHLAETHNMLGATYFFSSQAEEDLRRIDKVIPSIAYQLARFNAGYRSQLAQALEEDPDLASKTRQKQMQGLIIGPLQHVFPEKPVVLVLDALNECGERGSTEILQLILAAVAKGTSPLRILLTSRPEPYVLSAFSHHHCHRELILHNIDEVVIQNDIRLFLRDQLAYTNFHILLSEDWMSEQQLDLLVQDSGKLFIYAATAVRFIRDNRVHPPHEQLQLLLTKSRPLGSSGTLTDLDELYLQLLDTAASTRSRQLSLEQIRDVVGAIVLARDPLSLEDMQRLLGVTHGYARAALYPLQSVIITPKFDEGVAQAFHQSFADFITNPHRCHDRRFSINKGEHEKRLVTCCLKIMLDGLHYNMANILDPSVPKADIPELAKRIRPEMSYACRFWVSHLHMVEPGDPDVTKLIEIFSSRCILGWIEVCSILNSINTAISSSSAAREWVQQNSSCSLDTMNILNDAYRFLLANGSLINAHPLQTHLSALPFMPSSTALWRTYGVSDVPTFKVLWGREESWPVSLAIWSGRGCTVTSVIFSPDGSRVAGLRRKVVWIWDAVSGDVVATLEGHNRVVNSVVFSPDGSRVVSGSEDTTVRIWDAVSGDVVATLGGYDSAIILVAFSPDGSQIASGSRDNTIRIWDSASGEVMATLDDHRGHVTLLAFSPDGSIVVSVFLFDTVLIWHAVEGYVVASREGRSYSVKSMAFSLDGSRIVSGSQDNRVRIWEAISGEILVTLQGHRSPVNSVMFSPDGLQVVSGSDDNTVRIWDTVSGEAVAILEGHIDAVVSVAFSPDGSRIVSGSEDNTVRMWSAVMGDITSEDAVSGDVVTMSEGHRDAVTSLAFSPSGSRVVSGSRDDTVRIWDALSGNLVATLKGHSYAVTSVAFSPEGSRIVSESSDSELCIWDAISGELLGNVESRSCLLPALARSSDGSRVASGRQYDIIWIWDAATEEVIVTLEGHSLWINSIAFSIDGSQVVSGSDDTTVRVWDAILGNAVATLKGHAKAVNSVAFSPGGSQVVSGSSDTTVRVWNATSGDVVILEGHTGRVTLVAFSLDGSRVVSSSDDNTIRIWEVGSGEVVAILRCKDSEADLMAATLLSSMSADKSINDDVIEAWITSMNSLNDVNDPLSASLEIEHQRIVWENSPDGPAKLCKLPPRFASDDIPTAVHLSRLALGNEDGVVTVLDMSSVLDGRVISSLKRHQG